MQHYYHLQKWVWNEPSNFVQSANYLISPKYFVTLDCFKFLEF